MDNNALRRKLLLAGYALALLAIVFVVMWLLSHVLLLVVLLSVCILMAYVLAPLVRFFENPITLVIPRRWTVYRSRLAGEPPPKVIPLTRRGVPRVAAILVVYALVALVGGLVLAAVGPRVWHQLNDVVKNLPELTAKVQLSLQSFMEWLRPFFPDQPQSFVNGLSAQIASGLEGLVQALMQNPFPVVTKAFAGIASIVLSPLIIFYILMDVDRFRQGALVLMPPRRRKEFLGLLRDVDLVLGRYIRGQLVVCFTIGCFITVALLAFHIKYAILIGVFAGIIDIIPYVGVIMGMIPAVLLALVKGGPILAFQIVLTLMVIHWLEGHIVVPLVVGESVKLPPLVVMAALIAGAELGGIAGMFLAVPIAAVVRVVVNHYVLAAARVSVAPIEDNGEDAENHHHHDPHNHHDAHAPTFGRPSEGRHE